MHQALRKCPVCFQKNFLNYLLKSFINSWMNKNKDWITVSHIFIVRTWKNVLTLRAKERMSQFKPLRLLSIELIFQNLVTYSHLNNYGRIIENVLNFFYRSVEVCHPFYHGPALQSPTSLCLDVRRQRKIQTFHNG